MDIPRSQGADRVSYDAVIWGNLINHHHQNKRRLKS